MADLNDLVTLLSEPADQFDIDSSPLLDTQNEEDIRSDSFSPIVSPTKELLGEFPASGLTLKQENLPQSPPEAPKFPRTSPLSNFKLRSPLPSSFRWDIPKEPALAQASSVLVHRDLQNAPCEASQDGVTKLDRSTSAQEQSGQVASQESQACKEEAILAPRSKDRRTTTLLNLPTDRFLTGRERLVTATLHCLQVRKNFCHVWTTRKPLLKAVQYIVQKHRGAHRMNMEKRQVCELVPPPRRPTTTRLCASGLSPQLCSQPFSRSIQTVD